MKFKVEIPHFDCLPKRLERLADFSYNLWWSWHAPAREIYRRLDHAIWQACEHNPVRLLQTIDKTQVQAASENPHFLALYDSVIRRYDEYMNSPFTWFSEAYPQKKTSIAYFCAEFGLHNSLPFYSGGLGLLAGDTCKEASDLGIPLVAVGALYPEGYFHQEMESDGRQLANYTRFEPARAPVLPVLNPDGSRLLVGVPLGSDEVRVAVWKVLVGRVPIFLMDTDIEENDVWLRDVTARLYGGDQQVRLRQEIILGMGGARLLRELGFRPEVFHLNEGHAAFAAIERLREQVGAGMSFEDALDHVRRSIVFTTHTPVQTGHDEFPFDQMEEYFSRTWELLGVSRESFLGLGQFEERPSFSMTVLALRTSSRSNGVSKRHCEITRDMWRKVWNNDSHKAPIQSITNGVHVPTWIANELVELYEKFVGPYWWVRHDDAALWERILHIPDRDLWETHLQLKSKLLNFVRGKARRRWLKRVSSADHLVALGAFLSPDVLTIGFARRFATYKRSTLIFRDMERLKNILRNPRRPVQIIFSGKAHPADEPGKYLLQQVFKVCSSSELAGHVAFVEDYDKHVAHYLISGVDVWLNTPIPPFEASGTSGQKASLNGIPNLSVPDGWWFEGYNRHNGWSIEGDDDDSTANSIYDLLENEITTCFYDRDSQDIPKQWIALMKETIRSIAAPFSARRMMKEYVQKLYLPGENGALK